MTEERTNYLPTCWEDEARMLAYFSPFRSMANNFEGQQSKLTFWKLCIDNFCRVTKTAVFSLEDLNKCFIRHGKIPQCLQAVIEEMQRSKEICDVNDFMNMRPPDNIPESWSAWLWTKGKAPMYWAWDIVKSKMVYPRYKQSASTYFVHKGTIQVHSEEVMLQASSVRGEVLPVSILMAKCNWPEAKIQSFLMVLHWLHCQNKAAFWDFDFTCPSKTLVKLATVDHDGSVTISELDKCKYDLLEQTRKVEAKIAEYEEKVQNAKEEARRFMAKNSKILALSQLKKKKMYEGIIQKQANILNNFHGVLETLNETESNREVVKALRSANAAIKTTQKESNLSLDTVEDVMEELRETIENQDEINSALSQTVVPDEDVEDELAEIERDMKQEEDLCKWVQALKLPDLPGSPEMEETKSSGDDVLQGELS